MTLTTLVGFRDPVDPDALHEFINTELLGAESDVEQFEAESTLFDGGMMLRNMPDQELDALAAVHYREDDQPLAVLTVTALPVITSLADPQGVEARVVAFFDTPYRYVGPGGMSPSRLHVQFIERLAAQYPDNYLVWRNDFTQMWHAASDTDALVAFAAIR